MELRDYLNVISIRRGVIISAILIVAFVALAVSLIEPKVYSGEARVLISERDTGAALFGTVIPELSSQPERALQTQVQLVEVRPVAEETIKKLDLGMTPEDLQNDVAVTSVGQTNLISIRAQAGSPELAAQIANTMADEYVAASKKRKRESIKAAADEIEQRLNVARDEILEIGRRIQTSGQSEELGAQLQIATGTYTTLADKLEQLRINEQLETGSGAVVQQAVASNEIVSPKPFRNAMLGVLVGLVFGLVMAFLYEYLDNTVKSTEEAERVYGAAVIGHIPAEKMEPGRKRQLAIVESPGSPAAEAYRMLRNSLDFVNFEHDIKTLMVTSAAPAEGKSTVVANLAMSLAQAGKKVALVACDFRRPTTDQFFQVNNMIGLSDVLLGTHSLKAALQQTMGDRMVVLTAGKMPPNPNELLGSAKMKEIIASLEEWADWVIIDTPPVLAVADPVSVARMVDGVLMVSKAGESTREAATKSVELLSKVGARVIGVVVWGLDETKNRAGYGYGYYTGGYYYYKSYYGAPGEQRRSKGGNEWAATPTPRQRVAGVIGRLFAGILAFLTVLAIAAIAAYFLDNYFGWGLAKAVMTLLGR